MGTQKPDITKEESGLQQYDGLAPSKEPSMSYNEGKRLRGDGTDVVRSPEEEKALNDAQIRATGNRRDKMPPEDFARDPKDVH